MFIEEYLFFHFLMLPVQLPFIFLLDCILGELNFLPHPVVLMGKVISKSEKFLRKIFGCKFPVENVEELNSKERKIKERIAGTILVLIVCSISFSIPLAIELFLINIPPITRYFSIPNSQFSIFNFQFSIFIFLDVFWGYQSIAARCLCDEANNVHKKLSISLEEGQNAVGRIVGRDTKVLDEKGVVKACVETVAENTTDGIFSPIFFYIIGGAPLAFLYKAINTMDSMIAYKNDRYRFFGTVAARLDDVANFIPARLCAFFMILSSVFFPKLKTKNAIKIFFRDRYKHASPNSAQTESVMAGLLGVQLAGEAIYEGKIEKKPFLGDDLRKIEKDDIKKSVFVMYAATILFLIIVVLFSAYFLYN